MAKSASSSIEALFTDHSQRLVSYLRSKTGCQEDAEDIAQTAFIRVDKASSNGVIANPKAYLYQTASNILVDMKRRERVHESYLREATVHAGGIADVSNQPHAPSPDLTLDSANNLKRVERAVARLPHQCRQAFLMHRIKGLSYAEIADILGVSVSSVEKYILQALRHCRQTLKS